jgi:hypothetical protein
MYYDVTPLPDEWSVFPVYDNQIPKGFDQHCMVWECQCKLAKGTTTLFSGTTELSQVIKGAKCDLLPDDGQLSYGVVA